MADFSANIYKPENSKIKPYFDTLQADLADHRDPRGKRHNLSVSFQKRGVKYHLKLKKVEGSVYFMGEKLENEY